MVLIKIEYAPNLTGKTEWWLKTYFIPALIASVGKHLQLPIEDVGVRPRPFSELDIHQQDIEITMTADYHPTLAKNTPHWQQLIIADIAAVLNNQTSFYLRVRPFDGTGQSAQGTINECVRAQRLIRTIEHGNDLVPELDAWLRNHVTACDGTCPDAWKRAQALLHG